MAELIGLLSAIIQLVDTVVNASVYARDFRDAPKEQQALFSEIQGLLPLLTNLKTRVQENPSANGVQQLQASLTPLEDTVKHLVNRLQSRDRSLPKLSGQLIWALWNKKQAKDELDRIERFKTLLNAWLALDNWDVGQQQERHHDRILKEVTEVARDQRQFHDSAERENIIEWLSPLNYFAQHEDLFRNRQEGTCTWFLEDKRVQEWIERTGGTLWCNGMPGAGKTVLSAIVVNQFRNQFQNENIGVACAYLNHKENSTQSPPNILAGLWWQLILEKPFGSQVHKLYNQHHNQHTRPSLEDVHEVLRSTVGGYSKVFIVIDALDEYLEEQRYILLEHLAALGTTVNLMLTSRPHITPSTYFPSAELIEIRAAEGDIRRYLDTQMRKSFRLAKHVKARPELREEIETRIVSNVDGMFLLAKLHIDSLTTKNTVKAVRDALQSLPKDLEHTYNEAMDRIYCQSEDDREIARRTLIWVANAKRPLTVSELREALAIEINAESLDPDNLLDIDIIISVCAGLVIVEEHRGFVRGDHIIHGRHIVRLVHYTTQAYLDRIQSSEFPLAQTEITSQCLAYISFDRPNPEMISPKHHPLLEYARNYCLIHAAGQPEVLIRDEITSFLGKASRWRFTFHENGDWAFDFAQPPDSPWSYKHWPESPSKLFVCALFNLGIIAAYLLATDGEGERDNVHPLIAASYYGHYTMAKLLLDHSAIVDAEGPGYGNALQAASRGGHGALGQMLILKGANVSAHAGDYGSALHAAAEEGHNGVIEMLVDIGVDVNEQGGEYGSALQAASAHGHEVAVRLLLNCGADIHARGGHYGSALQAASAGGHEALVRLFIMHGANVKSTGGIYGTALQAASKFAHKAVVQLLLDNGADVNVLGGVYGSTLQAAASEGDDEVVRLLVDRGADLNAQGGKYGSALQAAFAEGHEGVARILIEKGVDMHEIALRRRRQRPRS